MIQAVVFDMDGILIDTEALSLKAWLKTAEVHGIENMQAHHNHCVGMTRQNIKTYLSKQLPNHDIELLQTKFRAKMEEMIQIEGLPIKPGAIQILQTLDRLNLKIGLATSTSKKSAMNHLAEAKILDFFDIIVTGDMVENGKPAPDIYLQACAGLEVSPFETIGVEDSYNGVISSASAGLQTVMIPDILPPNEMTNMLAKKTFKSLFELEKAILNNEFN